MASRFTKDFLFSGAASLAIAFCTAGQAFADPIPVPQQAEDTSAAQEPAEEDMVVVTGFRRSLTNAIANKRNSDIIIESISAEDIGRLPDISIAEALARLPGIASQRTEGQASAINIRGLSQNLVFSTLNGREQVTQNGNRSVEFDQYPSELLAGADVYKSPKASLIEGGLAGTVELRTVRPLDRDERSLTFNIRGSYNDRANEIFGANEFAYRFSGSYVDQFFNDTLGIAIGYARLVQPDVSTRFVGFDYDGFAPNDFNGDGANDVVSFGFETEEQGGRNARNGAFGTLQFKPNRFFEANTDVFYSRFNTESFGRGVRVIGPQAVNFGNPNTLLTNPVVAGRALIGGNLSRNVGAPTAAADGGFGLTIQGINDSQEDLNSLITVGQNLKFEAGRFMFKFDFTYSQADSTFANEVSAILPISSLNGGVAPVNGSGTSTALLADTQSVSFLLRGTDLPLVDFGQDLTDRSVWRLSRFGVFPFENEDRLYAFKGDAAYEVGGGVFSAFEAGIRYSTRDASQRRVSADFGNDAGFFQFAQNQLAPIALNDSNSQIGCFSGSFAAAGFPCFLIVPDPRALVEAQVGPIVADQSQQFTRNESFTISENVIAGYIQGNFDTEVLGLPMTGNIGLRVVHTDQSSFNVEINNVTGQGSVGRSYTQFLPSANFIFKLTGNDVLRFAGSRAIARAPLGQLGGGVGLSFDETQNRVSGGGGGNAGLLPFLANQGDISYEHYFGSTGILQIAVFYKALQSFIVSEEDETFNFVAAGLIPLLGDPNTDIEAAQFLAAGSPPIGVFNGPVNGEGGFVRGFEVGLTGSASFLPHPFDGLGASINYSYTDSQIDFVAANSGTALTLPLPGLSNHVFNATVFYDYEGFTNRVGLRYRSDFISPQVGINQQLPFTNNELVVDYQASYEFSESSPLKGLTLLFQANNLTDEPVRTFFGNEAQTGTLQYFGRQFFIGASYNF